MAHYAGTGADARRCWSRCSSASSRPPSAPCSRPSASPAWTAWCASNIIAKSGRAVEAAGDVDMLLLDKTGTITLGNRQATRFVPVDGRRRARSWPRRRSSASLADETPEGRSIVVPREGAVRPARARDVAAHGARLHPVHGPDAHERRRPGRPQHPQGRGRRRRAPCGETRRRRCPPELDRDVDGIARAGATPLVVVRRRRARSASVELKDIVKERHPRALRAAARDGHPHGHDHGRQPADRRGHRRRGRRRRLPRRGHARGQAGAHPQGAGRAASWWR